MSTGPPGGPDWLAVARRVGREPFCRHNGFWFLVGRHAMLRPDRPRNTLVMEIPPGLPGGPPGVPQLIGESVETLVFAVRKVQQAFPHMITVGRTGNNDIVISDVSISKFHAWFRAADDGKLELADAGSRNGTWVGEDKLEPKAMSQVSMRSRVRFAKLQFTALDAGAFWDQAQVAGG
jgi:hypothetical protein